MKFFITIIFAWLLCFETLHASDLSIMNEGTSHAFFSLNNRPVITAACSAPFLFFADSTVFDLKQWVDQQKILGILHVTIPISLNWQNIEAFVVAHGGKPEDCIFPYIETQHMSRKFDLTRFNLRWWKRLRENCSYLADNGFIIQLVLWDGRQLSLPQELSWDGHFFNPANNIDTVTKALDNEHCIDIYHACADQKTELIKLQERLFRKVLESTFDVGSVYYNLCYQLSENQGYWEKTVIWIDEMYDSMRNTWRGLGASRQFIIGLDAGGMSEYQQDWIFDNNRLNIMINSNSTDFNQLSRWRKLYMKPYCSTPMQQQYQTEYETIPLNELDKTRNLLWYNSFIMNPFSVLYINGLKMQSESNLHKEPTVKQFVTNVSNWNLFWSKVEGYGQFDFQGKISSRQYKSKLIQSSQNEAILYLSSGIDSNDKIYKEERINVERTLLDDGDYIAQIWDPVVGIIDLQDVSLIQGAFHLDMPGFSGGLAVHLVRDKK